METVKVTKSLAQKVEITAKQLRVSKEKLVSLALEDFLERKRNNDLLKAINEAYKKRVVLVAGAGNNNGANVSGYQPANCKNVISVAAETFPT